MVSKNIITILCLSCPSDLSRSHLAEKNKNISIKKAMSDCCLSNTTLSNLKAFLDNPKKSRAECNVTLNSDIVTCGNVLQQ